MRCGNKNARKATSNVDMYVMASVFVASAVTALSSTFSTAEHSCSSCSLLSFGVVECFILRSLLYDDNKVLRRGNDAASIA